MSQHDIIIIGGGIAGLTAAVHLAERGLTPLLLEAEPEQIGGRLKDGPVVEFEHQGQIWQFPGEHGMHGIWSPYANFKGMLARHGLTPQFVAARDETWILGQGKRVRKAKIGRAIRRSWVPAPFHYLQLFLRPHFLAMINWRDIAAMFRVLGSLFAAMAIDPMAEQQALSRMSLADFTRGWSPTLQNLFAGLARNALAAHPDEVPAAGFIAFLRFYTIMRRDAWTFDYLPGPGGSQVSRPLARLAQKLGSKIEMDARVIRLERTDAGWQLQVAGKEGPRRLTARQLLLAVDAPAARRLLQESPDTAEKAAELHFPAGVPTAIIRIWFDRRPKGVSEAGIFSGDFIVDNFFWLEQIHQAYADWHRATGGSAVEMHIYGPPELLEQPDTALMARVAQDIHRAFPELRGQRRHIELLRNPAVHTLFGIGEKGHNLTVTSPWPDLFVCGDWVYHPSPALYLERATTTALAAANALLQSRDLEPWPIAHPPQPEWLAGKIAAAWTRVRRLLKNKR